MARRPSTNKPVPRKADLVARAVLADIVRGKHVPGAILPKEDEIAERFRVNRGVVREAMKLLEVHRLVQPVRRRGTVVLDPSLSLSPEVLLAMLLPRRGQVDVAMMRHFLEVRALIDVEMAVLAARRRTRADIAELTRIHAAMQESAPTTAAFLPLQKDFADAMARATKNPVFPMFAAWNRRVMSEMVDALSLALPPTPEHVEGLGVLLSVIRRGEEAEIRTLVTAYHAWLTPRIIDACAARSLAKKKKKETS